LTFTNAINANGGINGVLYPTNAGGSITGINGNAMIYNADSVYGGVHVIKVNGNEILNINSTNITANKSLIVNGSLTVTGSISLSGPTTSTVFGTLYFSSVVADNFRANATIYDNTSTNTKLNFNWTSMWLETIGGGGGGGSGATGFTITSNKLYAVSLSGGGGGAAGSYNSTMIHSTALQISGLPVKMIAYIGLGGQGAASKTLTATYNASGTFVASGISGGRGGASSFTIINSPAIGSYSCAISTNGSTNSYLIFSSLPSISTGSFIYLNNQFNTIGTYTLTSGYYYFQLSIILPISFNNPTIFNSYTIYYPFTSANAITNNYCCSFGGEGGYGGVTSNTAVTAAQTGISTFPAQSNTGIGVYANAGGNGLRGSYGQGGSGGGGGGCINSTFYNGGLGGYVLSHGVYDTTTPTGGIYGAALAGAAGSSKGFFPGTGGGGGACSTSIGTVSNSGGNAGYGAGGGGGGAIAPPVAGYSITQNTTVSSGSDGNGGPGLFKAIFYL
jgi:hypothetical protein